MHPGHQGVYRTGPGTELHPRGCNAEWQVNGFNRPALLIDSWAEKSSQCLDVMGEGLSTAFGDAIKGLRSAQHELLFDCNIASLFQLEQLSPKVGQVSASIPSDCRHGLSCWGGSHTTDRASRERACGTAIGRQKTFIEKNLCLKFKHSTRIRLRACTNREFFLNHACIVRARLW